MLWNFSFGTNFQVQSCLKYCEEFFWWKRECFLDRRWDERTRIFNYSNYRKYLKYSGFSTKQVMNMSLGFIQKLLFSATEIFWDFSPFCHKIYKQKIILYRIMFYKNYLRVKLSVTFFEACMKKLDLFDFF